MSLAITQRCHTAAFKRATVLHLIPALAVTKAQIQMCSRDEDPREPLKASDA